MLFPLPQNHPTGLHMRPKMIPLKLGVGAKPQFNGAPLCLYVPERPEKHLQIFDELSKSFFKQKNKSFVLKVLTVTGLFNSFIRQQEKFKILIKSQEQ